jgi:anti-anti-sigma factor
MGTVQAYLRVSVREQGHSAIVEVDGELDLASSHQLALALDQTWRKQPRLVVLELGDLRFIDMAGLRVLLVAQQRAEHEHARLVLANVREPVHRVMRLANVTGLFTILEDVA